MSVVYPNIDVGSLTGVGAAFRLPVRVATAAAGTLSTSFAAGQTVNGVVLATNDRILIKNQATASENGIYVVTAGTPTRAEDYAAGQSGAGVYVYITSGTTAPNSTWFCTSAPGSDIIGTNNLTFAQVGDVVTTATQTLTNKTIGSGSTWSGGTISVASGGTGATTLTSGNVLVGAGTSAVTTTKAAPVGAFVGTTDSQTLTNKTLTAPVIATIVNTGTLTLPTTTDTLVGRATTDTLTNKTLTAPVIATIVNTGTLTLPTSTDTLVGRATTDTLTNKTLTAGSTAIADGADSTKRFVFLASGATTGTTLTLSSTQAASATISFPNVTTSDTLVGAATAATLTNKTLTLPVIAQISNSGTLTLPTSTDTLVGRATTDTLTNKTLTAGSTAIADGADSTKRFVFLASGATTGAVLTLSSTQAASATISFPNVSTSDTLVGVATAATLTNKTLTGTTNTIEATAIRSATTAVVVNAATAPTAGQVLTATSGTAASWQNPTGGGITGPGTSTDRAIATYNGTAGNALRDTGVTIDASNNIAGAGNVALTGSILDANGATLIAQTATASAVNYINITNAATGSGPIISAVGSDVTIPLTFAANADEAGANILNFNFINAGVPGRILAMQIGSASTAVTQVMSFPSGNAQTWTFPDATGIILLGDNNATVSNKALDTTNIFIDSTTATKVLALNLSGMTASRTLTLSTTQSTTQTLAIPNVGSGDSFVTNNTTATLTNKTLTSATITGATNTVEATALRSATTAVAVNAATAPTAGQVLTATSSTAANWQTLSPTLTYYSSWLVGASTTNPSLVTVFSYNPTVVAGTYWIQWSFNYGCSVTTATASTAYYIDGVLAGPASPNAQVPQQFRAPNVTGGIAGYYQGFSVVQALSGGARLFELRAGIAGGSTSISLKNISLIIIKLA